MHKPRVMANGQKLAGLAGASDHLKHAHRELLSAGYGSWVADLLDLLETITLEMEWLLHEDDAPQSSA